VVLKSRTIARIDTTASTKAATTGVIGLNSALTSRFAPVKHKTVKTIPTSTVVLRFIRPIIVSRADSLSERRLYLQPGPSLDRLLSRAVELTTQCGVSNGYKPLPHTASWPGLRWPVCQDAVVR
jgi:hypothetical protein